MSFQSDAKKQGNDLILLLRVYHELSNFQLRTVKNLTTLARCNSGEGGVGGFLGILGGGMPPGSSNSDPTLDQILETLRSNDADDNENVKKNNRFN